MVSLKEVRNNHWCRIAWLMGTYADMLRSRFSFREEGAIRVISNDGRSVLVDYGGKKIAMSADVANSLKVVCLD